MTDDVREKLQNHEGREALSQEYTGAALAFGAGAFAGKFEGYQRMHKICALVAEQDAEIERLREALLGVRIWNDDGNGRVVHGDLADHISAALKESNNAK